MFQDFMLKRTIGLVTFIWTTFMVFTYILSLVLEYTYVFFKDQIILKALIPIFVGLILVLLWLSSWYLLTVHVLHSGFRAREKQEQENTV